MKNHTQSNFLASVVWWVLSIMMAGLAYGQPEPVRDIAGQIDAAIAQAAGAYKTSGGALEARRKFRGARDRLENLPAEQVIPALINALEQDSRFQSTRMNKMAYEVLSHHKAVETEMGFNFFMAGLDEEDEEIAQYPDWWSAHWACMANLAKCAANKRIIVLDRFQKMLNDPGTPKSWKQGIPGLLLQWRDATPDVLTRVFDIVSKQLSQSSTPAQVKERIITTVSGHGNKGWGESARPLLKAIETAFADRNNTERVRWAAIAAMLRIGGLEYALKRFSNVDTAAEKMVMYSLLTYMVRHDESCSYTYQEKYRKLRVKARKLVLRTLTNSTDYEARKAAWLAIRNVYGLEWVIFDLPDGFVWDPQATSDLELDRLRQAGGSYHWDPEIKAAFENRSAHEPNPKLRESISFALRSLDYIASVQLRRQRRIERNQKLQHEKQPFVDVPGRE